MVVVRGIAELARHMIEKVPPDMSQFLLAPMPGLLTRLEVGGRHGRGGPAGRGGQAMKMENILRAEKSATVKATQAKAGDRMAVDQVIVEFEWLTAKAGKNRTLIEEAKEFRLRPPRGSVITRGESMVSATVPPAADGLGSLPSRGTSGS